MHQIPFSNFNILEWMWRLRWSTCTRTMRSQSQSVAPVFIPFQSCFLTIPSAGWRGSCTQCQTKFQKRHECKRACKKQVAAHTCAPALCWGSTWPELIRSILQAGTRQQLHPWGLCKNLGVGFPGSLAQLFYICALKDWNAKPSRLLFFWMFLRFILWRWGKTL